MYYVNLLELVLAVGLAMTKTISKFFSQTCAFIWHLNNIHLILLQLKTKSKHSTDLKRLHLDRREELI